MRRFFPAVVLVAWLVPLFSGAVERAGYPKIVSGTKTGGEKPVAVHWEKVSEELIAKSLNRLTGKPMKAIYTERVVKSRSWADVAETFKVSFADLEKNFEDFQDSFKREVKEKEGNFSEAAKTLKAEKKSLKAARR